MRTTRIVSRDSLPDVQIRIDKFQNLCEKNVNHHGVFGSPHYLHDNRKRLDSISPCLLVGRRESALDRLVILP